VATTRGNNRQWQPGLKATSNFTVTVNPTIHPVVGSVTVLGGQVNLVATGAVGPDYTLWASTNLTSWQVLFTSNSPVRGHLGGHQLQRQPRPLLSHPVRPMNQPIVKFASVHKGEMPFCRRRILHENHSFVHSIKKIESGDNVVATVNLKIRNLEQKGYMKNYIKTLAIVSTLAIATSAYANITLSHTTFGSSTDFPSTSISTLNGTLSFEDVLASPAGATLQGSTTQGTTANAGFGEIFNWTGSAVTLSAVTIIDMGGGGGANYQPFLFDLGPTIYNTMSSTFNPSAQTDLFGNYTLTPGAVGGSGNFIEFDLSGSDAITLNPGDSYAFGLLNNNSSADFNFRRSSGGSSDPNGIGYTLTSLSATTITDGMSGNNRTMFIGLYTEVPEPSTLVMVGLGILAGGILIRRRQKA